MLVTVGAVIGHGTGQPVGKGHGVAILVVDALNDHLLGIHAVRTPPTPG